MNLTYLPEALPFASWQAQFPRIGSGDIYTITVRPLIDMGRNQGYPEGYELKVNGYLDIFDNRRWPTFTSQSNMNGVSAFPTVAEASREAQLRPDLVTYASELMTALIMGQRSLDNWNTYIADLRRLGLDELLAIYQARLDRMR